MMTDCNNPKLGEINSEDRLSDLPDFIIHHIISYLNKREVYRTSVLSKRWNQIIATYPILDIYHCYNDNFRMEMLPRLMEYIDTRMQKFSKENLRITRFRLGLPANELLLACKVDEWLEIAVCNQVAEIDLGGPSNYKLPRILFCAKSLRRLQCDNVEIPYFEAVDLVSLESLILGNEVVIEEGMLFHIISSCQLLKELVLSFCPGFENLVIPSHSKLEYLYIEGKVPEDGGRVILETSSLRSFKYNVDSVSPWPTISNRGLLRNLNSLSVTSLSITGEDLAKVLLELPSLEKLGFIGCLSLKNIEISHTQLKQISFSDCYYLENVVIDAPCLKKFKFYDEIIDPSLSITIHSQDNCNIHVEADFDSDGFFILKKLLKGLNSCNVLKLQLSGGGGGGDGAGDGDGDGDGVEFEEEEEDEEEEKEEEEEEDLGPPCDIGELTLNLYSYSEPSSSSLSDFLNGLFWTCHPPIISLRFNSGCRKLTVEPLVNQLVDMVKCLSHPLKRIEVGETTTCPDSHKPTTPHDALDIQLSLCW